MEAQKQQSADIFLQKQKYQKDKKRQNLYKQNLMSINSSQLTSINERKFIKSSSFSRLNKQRSIRKFAPSYINSGMHEPVKKNFNDNQINMQISKQMREIDQLLALIRPQLQQIARKNSERTIMQTLFDLQERIKGKNQILAQITNENKQLKSSNKKGLRSSQSLILHVQNPEQEENTFKLAQQLRRERQELLKVKNQHLSKKDNLDQIKDQILKVELEYIQKCKKTKQKPLTYEMFKCFNEQKKRELNNELQLYQRKRNKRETLKEILKSNSLNTTVKKTQKNLKQIVNRKKVAEQALKTTRKKYSQQLSEFHAKLEFLRQEDSALIQTLREKEVEYYTLENRFNQSRKNLFMSPKNRAHHVKLQNTLRFKGQNFDMDEFRKTKKYPHILTPQYV